MPLGQCLSDHPGIVGMGVAAGVGTLASVGLAVGAGWELGASDHQTTPRRRRARRVLGGALLGMGLAGVASARIAFMTAGVCGNIDCHERQREVELVTRNASALLIASGAGLVTAMARHDRVRLQSMYLAHGGGISLTLWFH